MLKTQLQKKNSQGNVSQAISNRMASCSTYIAHTFVFPQKKEVVNRHQLSKCILYLKRCVWTRGTGWLVAFSGNENAVA
jgi:hypothetical protein